MAPDVSFARRAVREMQSFAVLSIIIIIIIISTPSNQRQRKFKTIMKHRNKHQKRVRSARAPCRCLHAVSGDNLRRKLDRLGVHLAGRGILRDGPSSVCAVISVRGLLFVVLVRQDTPIAAVRDRVAAMVLYAQAKVVKRNPDDGQGGQ